METWDVSSLEIEAHHPQVLRSDAETRAIAIQLPAGEQLQSHQVHERTYMIVVAGEIKISHDGGSVVRRPRAALALRAERAPHDRGGQRRPAGAGARAVARPGTSVAVAA